MSKTDYKDVVSRYRQDPTQARSYVLQDKILGDTLTSGVED